MLKQLQLYVLPLYCVLLMSSSLLAASFSLTPTGISVPLKGIGDIVFSYPKLIDGAQKEQGKIIESRPDANGQNITVKYDNGAEVHFAKKSDTRLELSIVKPPAGLQSFRFEALVPFAMNEGGKYKVDQGTAADFPMQKPAKPQIYQDNASEFELLAPNGETFAFKNLPPGSFLQIQDNREWNWSIFSVMFMASYNKDHAVVPYDITFGKAADMAARKMVDRFGQDFSHPYAGKIKSEEELKEDVKTEQAYYDSLPKAKRDSFGGMPGTGKLLNLKKTGFFHVEKSGGRWYIVNPEGNAFFHLGLCTFNPGEDYTYVEGRTDIYEWLPPRTGDFATAWHKDAWWSARAVSFYLANVIRKYGKPYDQEEWAARMVDRVRAFGFTSVGNFSAVTKSMSEKNFPYVRSFGFWGLGNDIPGARGFFDPFNAEVAKKIDENFAGGVAQHADDPLLIGYYLANEQGAEDLPKALAALEGKFAAKKALVNFLTKKYKTIAAFNKAWEMKAASFDALTNQGLPISSQGASDDMTEFVGLFLDKYYSLLNDTFRKYDKNHMLLGSRWQPGTANNEILVKTCAKYCEVVSVNYYTVAIDRDYLDRLHRWSGDKPFVLSEWHFSSISDSGLPGGHGNVNSQKERGLAYRNYVEQAAATDYVVGIEWFTLLDQARSGRFFEHNTGERANTGFFSVTDRPWKDFIAEVIKTNIRIEDLILKREKPFQFDDPRFTQKGSGKQSVSAVWVEKPIKIDGSRDGWPVVPPVMINANRIAIGTKGEDFTAAYRVSWDEKNLYFFIDVTDKTPGKSTQSGADLWQGDGVEIFVGTEKLDQPGGLIFSDRQILIGAGQSEKQWFVRNLPASVKSQIVRSVQVKADGSGYYLEAMIPFEMMGAKPKEGMELLFDVAVDDSENGRERVRQFVWNGTDRVSNERGSWGKIRLSK